MDFDELRQILEIVREYDLSEFELEREDFKLRIKKNAAGMWTATTLPPVSHVHYPPTMPPPPAVREPAAIIPPTAPVLTAADEEVDLAVLKSPIVGTFYRAAEPDAKPFAEVGDIVRKGQVLCIIEAMKLMNEIGSDVDGEVVKVYVENGQPVQYGERLFAIKPLNV
jgi:acetyl-CoA carboxylase biotin carboxyl carrier protein